MERIRDVCHDNAVRAARYGERHRDAGNCPKDADLRALLALADAAATWEKKFTHDNVYHIVSAEKALVAAVSRVTQAGG